MLFQFDQQDQLRNEDHKKIINLNKIFLNVFTDGVPIFNYCWENRCTVFLEDSIKLFCLKDFALNFVVTLNFRKNIKKNI